MVVRCYCCNKRFKSDLELCPKCNFANFKHPSFSWLSEDLKIKHAENHKSIITPPTISEIESYTQNAANDCKFEIEELTVTDDFNGVMEVIQAEDNFHKLTINFNPRSLSRFIVDEIRAMLRHEIMHPITMQESSQVMVNGNSSPEVQKLEAAVQLAYDEMINYKEYTKRFPNDKDLHSSRQKMYTNFSIIFLTMKHQIENGYIVNNSPILYVHALAIYEDAVYNFFEDQNKLTKWANENGAQALYKFLEWIHEDFTLIQENTSNRDEMRKIISLTFKMIPTISIDLVYTSNTLSFNQLWFTAYPHCQRTYKNNLGTQLLERWKKRYDGAPYYF